jgi:anti-sigma regulatory factor (Ser/Thr protein kinase)
VNYTAPYGFLPHGFRFHWRPDMLRLEVASDALVALGFFTIAALVVWLARRSSRWSREREALLARYEREHLIAKTLQDASLPHLPDRIGTLDISLMYTPATGELDIGGDWYDAFRMPSGDILLSIGDITGTGLHASVVMAKVRQAIRIAAQLHVTPSAILDAADRSLRNECPDWIATAFVGVYDELDGVLHYASAGHPRPLLRLPDGAIDELSDGGLPLGLGIREEAWQLRLRSIPAGSLLLLYTDGLTESTHDYAVGERRLNEALTRGAVVTATNPARALHDCVLPDGNRDDVAILAVRFGCASAMTRWIFDWTDPDAAYRARTGLLDLLRERGASPEDIFMAETTYSELLGNIVSARTTIDVRLEWEKSNAVIHVLDEGPRDAFAPHPPCDLLAESGRGLFIISEFAESVSVVRRANGGSHARAMLHPFTQTGALALSGLFR